MLRRRNLLKRVLPILLSLAMTLQSVPITAMAAELPVAATAEEAEAATESSEETEAAVEPAEETGTTEDADAAESAAQPEEDATVEDTPAEDDVKSDETTENTGDQPDAVTEEDGVKSDDAAEDSESEPETVKKPVAETETEVAANGVVKEGAARIIVNDTSVWDGVEGFTRKLGETGLVFVGEYVEDSKVGELQDAVKYWLDIEVDGEEVYELRDSLTYSWAKVDGETRVPLVDAVPVNAGTYELTIALDIAGTNGLCKSVEPADGVKLTLIIEKAKINIWPDTWTQPGKTVGELIENNNENYQIVYADRLEKIDEDEYAPKYTVSRDIINTEGKKLPLHVYRIDDGARQDLTETPKEKFDSTKDYILTIEPESDLLTADAAENYELALDDFWKINIGERQETSIKFERKTEENGDLKDLIEVYEEGKTYSIEDVTKDLFTETGAPAVYVWDDKTEEDVILRDADGEPVKPVAGWYTRIQLEQNDKKLGENEKYKPDEEAGEFQYERKDEAGNDVKDDFIYKPMKENETPTDAGEYYIVWNYAGDEGMYGKSHSDKIRFTIDPAPVVVNIELDGVDYTEGKGAKLGFTDGMTVGDVRKTLAKIAYGVYPIKENEEGVPEIGKDKVNKEPEFFGTSYGIENKTQMTQYFVPEFVLQRRPVSMTEKDGTVITIPEEEVDGKKVKRAVDWNTVDIVDEKLINENYRVLNVVVDNENGELESIKAELPQDAEKDNLKSVEFEFRVYFTGNKVLYTNNGKKVWYPQYVTPVTDVTTNAANRNYLADITKSRLEDSAVLLDVASAVPVTINTDAIVQAFIDENGESLYPQLAEGAENPKGTFSDPAVKIYDQRGLFEKRASYKKAEVFDVENGDPGVTTNIKDTDERLTYTWSYIELDDYQRFLETWDKEQQKYKDFDEFYFENGEGWDWTNVEDGTLEYPKSAAVYRLTVKFNDKDLAYRPDGEKVYRSAEKEVFFKVEQQEVVVVPTKVQYVSKDDEIWSLSVSCNSLEIKKDYSIYKLPQNSEESEVADGKTFRDLLNEKDYASLEKYEIPTDDALASYATKNGKKYDTHIVEDWKVLRKAKDTAGQDTDNWVEVEDETETFDADYKYGIAANWTGTLYDLENEIWGDNYTTLDVKTYRETGEWKHHESVGEVDFYDGEIYVEVDKDLIEALGHEYDGTPFGKKADGTEITLEEVAKAITLYTDAELKNKLAEDCTQFINTTDEYDPTKINIYWLKDQNDEIYATKNAVYGGTYMLALRFEGGALAAEETAQDGETEPKYAPLGDKGWWYPSYPEYYGENVPRFTITPRAITITPELVSADLLKAGDKAYGLVTGNLTSGKKDEEGNLIKDEEGKVVESILEKDEKFFEYMELAKGGFDAAWNGTNPEGVDLEAPAYKYNVGSEGGYPAFDDGSARYVIQVDGKEIQYANAYLRYGKTYTVKLKNDLASPLAESYRVTYAPAEVKIENRGNAEVDQINGNPFNLSTGRIDCNFSGSTYEVMPRGAVKFYYKNQLPVVYDRYGEEKKLENTNVLGFRIWAPKEFLSDPDFGDEAAYTEKIVYKNAIWNAGGYFYSNEEAEWRSAYNSKDRAWEYYIDVVFPLTKDNVDRSFNITWENDYTETFKLADVVLEEDLTRAVAPKSIKFNGVATKMAVGERQQLNLKITKAQLGDVIAVRYRIKGSEETKNDYISLDPETGVVTGLMAGKVATQIEAYAVYKDAKGNFVPIVDSKGKQKVATTKITVTEVTASAIKKIVAQGNSAKVYYTVPDNGYRREVYVVDVADNSAAKKWKAAQFNDAIAGIKNGDWKTAGFAIAPRYTYAKNEDLSGKESRGVYDSKLKAHILTLGNLKAEHEYVVYVRNVSAVRELDDGAVVTLSAMGSVKKAKTTKSQVNSLELDFTLKTGENDKKNTVTHPVGTDGKVDTNKWTVELSAKKAQLNVYGLFSDKDAAADLKDQLRYPLVPTSKDKAIKAALKNYQLPKLEYAIFDKPYHGTFYDEDRDEDVFRYLNPFKPGETQSKYAAINKKGLISLKGVDLNGETTLYIYVRDNMKYQGTTNYDAEAYIELTVTSKATSFTGKKVKAVVGQEIRLADCLTYKNGKKTLPNYRSGNIQITPAMINAAKVAGYDIVDRGQQDKKNDRWVHDWYITAVSPNKNKFVLEVSDFDIDGNPKANITLTSKQVDPVKGLKVTYVDDKNITINFTHAANKNETDDGRVYQYAFEIKDARGNVVEKKILPYPAVVGDIDRANAKELKSVLSWIQKPDTNVATTKLKDNAITAPDVDAKNQFNYYTGTSAKVKTFAYTYTNEKLVRFSSYKISVTPLYGNQKADKAATTKTKTTNIPASYKNPDLTGTAPDRRGGTGVEITTTEDRQKDKDGSSVSDNSVSDNSVSGNSVSRSNVPEAGISINGKSAYPFVSGNTYTLKIDEDQHNKDVPRDRVTDTLTWKSSNTKVATIKANAGTYTATFKPVNQGETTITVTSKITKKVIARHAVKVVAVRDGAGYGGDYEPTWDNGFYENILALYDPYYDGPVEVLSVNLPLTISNDDTWVSFTAPHYGVYTLKYTDGCDVYDAGETITFYDGRDGSKIARVYENYDGEDRERNMLVLEANQKVYCKLGRGSWTVTGTELARLTKANTKESPLEVKEGHVSFTAWEDNVYTFWLNGTKVNLGDEEEPYYEARMNAGDTWYVWARTDGKMYVTWRDLGSTTAAELTKPFEVKLDMENQVRYVTYTAAVAGEYAFKFVVPDGVNHKISAANGEDLNRVPKDEVEKDGAIVEYYYLEKDQKVVVEFSAEITDATKTLTASVTVTAPERRKVEKEITIPKGTTEIVEYVIPPFDTEKAQFKFKVTDGSEIVKYLDKNYQDISDMNIPDGNWTKALDNNTLTVSKNTWPVFKAGDSIFIEVAATGNPENEDDKDAVLTVTCVSVDTLGLGTTPKDITNDTEQWFIFKAQKDGFYEFNVDVADRAAGDETETHEALLKLGRDLFAATDDWKWVRSNNDGTVILDLKNGETLALRLTPGTWLNNKPNADGTEEVIKSTANVSVNLLDIKALELNKAEPVKIDAGKKDVRYYSFTATVADNYTIGWKSDEGLKDVAAVQRLSNIPNEAPKYGTYFDAGEVCYIKVSINPYQINSGNPVSGSLCVTADNLNAIVLTENETEPYNLEDKDGAREQVFKFTAPKTAEYAVELTVSNDKDTDLPYNYPGIWRYKYVTYPDNYNWGNDQVNNNARYSLTKGQTCYFTLSLYGTDTETAGTILIRSLTEELSGDQPEVTVTNGVTKQYTFKIPESGRYEFKADYEEGKAEVIVQNGGDLRNASGRYYRKNQEVTIYVTGRDPEADASVKLYKPALITPKALVVGDNGVDVKAGGADYFEISVTDPKTFELKLKDIDGLANPWLYYAYDNNYLNYKYDDTPVIVSKNSKLFIKIMANDETKALTCKLNVAESKELKVGSNDINLKAGETVKMIFRAPEKGYYCFQVEGKDLVLNGEPGDSFNKFTGLMDPKETRTYTLTNEGTADVKSVTVKAIEPIPVTPGSKTTALDIPAGEKAYYALKTFKDARYLIKIADTSKGADLKVDLNGLDRTKDLKKIADEVTFEVELWYESLLCVENDGINKTSVTVELIKDEAQPLPADGVITLAKGESKLISFVAAEDNRYLISKDNDKVKMTLDKMQDASRPQSGYVDIDDLDDDLREIEAPKDVVLGKADKLVYRLSYTPDPEDERAAATQTVKVTIAAITPIAIGAASQEVTGENWYQFTAQKDALYTFSLEDEYKNDVSDKMTFYSYMTGEALSDQSGVRYMKNGQKVFIKLNGHDKDSKYTLKYEEVDVIKDGTYTLDFEYYGEVKELPFVVPNGGSYKISAAAFRGDFTVDGTMNTSTVMNGGFTTENGRGEGTTGILKKDDIVTLKVTANSAGKSSVSIRITKDNVAENMTLGTEYTGVSSVDKDIYYEIRIAETAFYAISAGGTPDVYYQVNSDAEKLVNGVAYTEKELTEGDRVMIKVAQGNGEAYSVKIAKIAAASLDTNDAADKALEVKTAGETASATNTGEKDYVFTKEKAYVKFIAPEDGNYYIAVQGINGTAELTAITSEAGWTNPGMVELKKDATVVFEVTNTAEAAATRANDASSKKAMFRLTIRASKAADKNPIKVGEEPAGTLARNEKIEYQFKAAKKAKYLISFKGSNCNLEELADGTELNLDADAVRTLTVTCSNGELGRYKLSVTELSQTELKPGVTASDTLETDAKAYYVFAPTVTAEDGVKYQVYWSGNVSVSYDKLNADGGRIESSDPMANNEEVTLKKDEKLSFTVKNTGNKNQGFKLTVKEVKATPITAADTAVPGSLDASEKAYYEFTSQNEKETPYQVYLDNKDLADKVEVRKVAFGEDGKLGEPGEPEESATAEVSLKKGEKLLIAVQNDSDKNRSYNLTVEDKTETPVEPTPIALGVKQIGKLNTEKEKAVYEFTADADETYSVYFTGSTCSYSWTTTETDAEGKAEEKTYTGNCPKGSKEFACKKGDKIRFTVSGIGKYELAVKKVTYTELTLGTQVSRTLNPGETVYYQFISKDTPATGEETTKYQVYGSGNIQTRTLTVGDDGKTDADNQYWSYAWYEDEKNLQKEKQILQFKATGAFNLTIKKVEYKPITLGTPVSGRFTFADDGNPYYEFTATDTPAEGAPTTRYYVYGTGYYDYSESLKEGEKITWSDVNGGYPGMTLWLEKDQRVRFKVTDSPYSLTVAKYPEAKPITVGTEIKTGSLTRGQQLVYTLKNDKDTAAYTLNYKETDGAWISPYLDYEYLDDDNRKRIIISKGSELRIEIGASEDVDDFAFTVSEFKPEELKLGETASKVLAAGETVYYQYPVAKTADYVLSMVSSKGLTSLKCEEGEVEKYSRYGNFVDDTLNFTEKAVVLFKVTNTSEEDKESFKLTLQEKPDDAKMTALEVKDNALSLKAGEVKYLKFTVPEAEQKNDTRYVVSYPEMSGVQYSSTGLALNSKYVDDEWIYYDSEVSANFTMRVANTSMSEKTCSINLQKRETLTLGTASEKTLKQGETVYYQYKVAETGEYVLSMAEQKSGDVQISAIVNEEITLGADEVQLFEVTANKGTTYKLTLQKKPADDKMTALTTTASDVTLQPGDVKYLKFTVPEGKSGEKYAISIPATSSGLKYKISGIDSITYSGDVSGDVNRDGVVSSAIVVRLMNVIMSEVKCSIDVQEYPYSGIGSGSTQMIITKEAPTQYYVMYCSQDNYKLTLTNEKKDVTVKYSTDTKATKNWTVVPADGKIALKGTRYNQIFLQISYSGQDAEREYTVTLEPWSETTTE